VEKFSFESGREPRAGQLSTGEFRSGMKLLTGGGNPRWKYYNIVAKRW